MTRTRITTDGITDASISTAKIIGQAVTYAKLQFASATNVLLGRSTAGSGVIEEIPLTSAGRALIDDADATAQRATLGLGTMATATAADYLPLAGGAITGNVTSSGTIVTSGVFTAQANITARRFTSVGQLVLSRAEGASGAPTAIASGADCGQVLVQGYHGAGYVPIGSLVGVATDVPTVSSSPGKLSFRTTPVGAVAPASRMEIYPDGSQYTVIPDGTTLYPSFACRAWVNFSGVGTVTIRGSGNVTSITDNGVGDYTINFATAMPDVLYSAIGCAGSATNTQGDRQLSTYPLTASTCKAISGNTISVTTYDADQVHVAIFR